MDSAFWLEKWRINQIGFHEGVPNTLLTAHFSELGVKAGARIFVPLCGKTRDLSWFLSKGFHVVGIELSRMAVEQFFREENLSPTITRNGALERFEAENITLFCGDIFDLEQAVLGHVDAVYDRAALIALPPEMRKRYATHVISITQTAPQFLITLDYDQSLYSGPPFAVADDEVHALYDAAYPSLIPMERVEAAGGIKGRGPAWETAWRMQH
ncbi:thiopurine S-methyltransferase [Acetobacter sp.]|uniref:thiopurine S-methyltransferase n=1 Tax=Acetobacter sp. TaxID=440 RepID=UPI0039EA32F5